MKKIILMWAICSVFLIASCKNPVSNMDGIKTSQIKENLKDEHKNQKKTETTQDSNKIKKTDDSSNVDKTKLESNKKEDSTKIPNNEPSQKKENKLPNEQTLELPKEKNQQSVPNVKKDNNVGDNDKDSSEKVNDESLNQKSSQKNSLEEEKKNEKNQIANPSLNEDSQKNPKPSIIIPKEESQFGNDDLVLDKDGKLYDKANEEIEISKLREAAEKFITLITQNNDGYKESFNTMFNIWEKAINNGGKSSGSLTEAKKQVTSVYNKIEELLSNVKELSDGKKMNSSIELKASLYTLRRDYEACTKQLDDIQNLIGTQLHNLENSIIANNKGVSNNTKSSVSIKKQTNKKLDDDTLSILDRLNEYKGILLEKLKSFEDSLEGENSQSFDNTMISINRVLKQINNFITQVKTNDKSSNYKLDNSNIEKNIKAIENEVNEVINQIKIELNKLN